MAYWYGRQCEGRLIRSANDLARYLLEQAHVATIPGTAFGGPDHLRVSYANAIERIEEGADRIAKALQRLR